MKPLKELQREYENARYMKLPDGELHTIVSVNKPKNSYQWFDEEFSEKGVELVPAQLIEEFQELRYPNIDMSMVRDRQLVEEALENIIICRVTNVIEAAPFDFVSDSKKMALEDLLVVEPISPDLQGAKIYVPHHKAGTFKTARLRLMVGQVVPVKIVELRERRYKDYHVYKSVKNSYVLEGDINIAQFLKNREFVKNIPKKWADFDETVLTEDYRSFTNKTYKGIISHFNSAGVYVVTNKCYTFFIRREDFGYATFSRIHKFVDTVDDTKPINFKFTGVVRHIDDPKEFGISNFNIGNTPLLKGEHISFETSPHEAIKQLIDSKNMVGRAFKGYIVQYDVVKGHLIELEEFPGVLVKLKHNRMINQNMMRTNEALSVVVKRARYTINDEGKIILTVNCTYNATLGKKQEMLADFFSSN